MPDADLTLTARIKGEIDRASMKAEAEKAQGLFSKIGMGGGAGGLREGITSRISQARAGGVGGILSLAGKATLALGVLSGIAFGIRKMVSALANNSAILKGTLSIMGRAFAIFWRPFGDALGIIILPMAKALLKFANMFLRRTRERGGGLTGIFATLVVDLPEAFGSWLWDQVTSLFGADQLKGDLDGFGAWLFVTLTATATAFGLGPFGVASGFGVWLFTKIKEAVNLESIKGFGNWLFTTIKDTALWGINTTMDFGSWIFSTIKNTAMWGLDTTKNFGSWVWNIITDTAMWGLDTTKNFGSWVWNTITDKDFWGIDSIDSKNFGSWVWLKITKISFWGLDTVFNLGSWLWEKIQDIFSFSLSGSSTGITSFANGGIATKPTLGVFGDAGPEAVIPLSKLGDIAGGGTTSVRVFIGSEEITGIVRTEIEKDKFLRGVVQ